MLPPTPEHTRSHLEELRAIARQIAAGSVEPKEGVRRIHEGPVDALGHPPALGIWCGFDGGYAEKGDRAPASPEVLVEAIRAEVGLVVGGDLDALARTVEGQNRLLPWSGRMLLGLVTLPIKWALQVFEWLGSVVRLVQEGIRNGLRGSRGLQGRRRSLHRDALLATSLVLQGAAVAVWATGLLMLGFSLVNLQSVAATIMGVVPLSAFVGHVLLGLGRRVAARTAAEAVAADPDRPPVLYLRSFVADRADEIPEEDKPVAFDAREEEVLASIFELVGPFVAIGDPGDVMPRHGAARAYVEGEDWRSDVLALMRGSSMVILRVGDTPGFLWEAETALRTLPPERVLFYFSQHWDGPRLESEYRTLRGALEPHLPTPLPQSIDGQRFLRFEAGWKPVLFARLRRPERPRAWLSPLTVAARRRSWRRPLIEALRPVFLTRGLMDPKTALFGDDAVGTAVVTGGPFAAGLLMASNAWAVGRRAVAVVTWAAALAFAASVLAAIAWSVSSFTAGEAVVGSLSGQRVLLIRAWILIVAYAAVTWLLWRASRLFAGGPVRRHLGLGGRTVSRWLWMPLVLVCTALWWTLVWEAAGAPL